MSIPGSEDGLEFHSLQRPPGFSMSKYWVTGSLIITLGKGMYYREEVAKVPAAPARKTGGGRHRQQCGGTGRYPHFPEGARPTTPFMDREMPLRQALAASMASTITKAHDPYWSELNHFLLSVRDNKPIIAPLCHRESDAKGVNLRETGRSRRAESFWPGKSHRKKRRKCKL